MNIGTIEILLVLLIVGALAVFFIKRRSRTSLSKREGWAKFSDLPATLNTEEKPGEPQPAAPRGHVFLSYASSDRSTAQALASALSGRGWSVWWDRTILPGKKYDRVIEEALNSARCVVVLWSRESVESDWVKTEASEGARRGILVPVLIENVTIPLEFRRLQAADLVGWNKSHSHPGFDNVARAVSALVVP
jgi:hypothetical protein